MALAGSARTAGDRPGCHRGAEPDGVRARATRRSAPGLRLCLRAVAADSAPARTGVALHAWTTFSALFDAHLDHEERDALPLLEYRLPPAVLRRFERARQRSMGLGVAMTQFFPWLPDGATPQRREHVLAGLPAPLRILVRRSRKGYERRTGPAWN